MEQQLSRNDKSVHVLKSHDMQSAPLYRFGMERLKLPYHHQSVSSCWKIITGNRIGNMVSHITWMVF